MRISILNGSCDSDGNILDPDLKDIVSKLNEIIDWIKEWEKAE